MDPRVSQKCRTYRLELGWSRALSAGCVVALVRVAHLTDMDINQRTRATDSSQHRPAGAADTGDGSFEAAYSIKELAERLHVSSQTLYDLRSQGRGPTGFRVGKHLRFRRSEVTAWLARLEEEDLDRHPHGGRR